MTAHSAPHGPIAAAVHAGIHSEGFMGRGFKVFDAPLTHSLSLAKGIGGAVFGRASTATVEDFEGRIIQCQQEEARFQGVRRVENILTHWSTGQVVSNDLTTLGIGTTSNGTTQSDGLTITAAGGFRYQRSITGYRAGQTLMFSFLLGSGSTYSGTVGIRFSDTSGTDAESFAVDVPNATAGKRYGIAITLSADRAWVEFGIDGRALAGGDAASTGSVKMTDIMIEDITGQTVQEPSEYVSVGVGHEEVISDYDYRNWNDFGSWTQTANDASASSESGALVWDAGSAIQDNDQVVIKWEITSYTAGTCKVGVGLQHGTARSSTGVYYDVVRADAVDGAFMSLVGFGPSFFTGTVKIHSAKKITYGSNVDGVKYFDTHNLNWIDANFVVQSAGTGSKFGRKVTNIIKDSSSLRPCSERFDDTSSWSATGGASVAAEVLTGGPGETDGHYNTVTFSAAAGDAIAQSNTITVDPTNKSYRISCWMRSSSSKKVRLSLYGGAPWYSPEITLTSDWKRYSHIVTPTSGSYIQASVKNNAAGTAGSFDIAGYQIEDVTNQSNQNPGEYVPVGMGVGVEQSPDPNFTDEDLWTDHSSVGLSWLPGGGVQFLSGGKFVSGGPSPIRETSYAITIDYQDGGGTGTLEVYIGDGLASFNVSGAAGVQTKVVAFTGNHYPAFGDIYIATTGTATVQLNSCTVIPLIGGTGVEGVAEYAYTNPHTVDGSNIVNETENRSTVTPGKGLLIEAAKTNVQPYSNDFGSGGWVTGTVGMTVQTDTGPSMGGFFLHGMIPSASGSHYLGDNTTALAALTEYVISAYVAPGVKDVVQLTGPSNPFGTTVYQNFLLQGAGSKVGTPGGGVTDAGIEYINDLGVYRIWIKATTDATPATWSMLVAGCDGVTTAGRLPSYAPADTTNPEFYVGGCQIEAQVSTYVTNLTSYQPTAASAVSRAADSLEYDIGNLPTIEFSVGLTVSDYKHNGNINSMLIGGEAGVSPDDWWQIRPHSVAGQLAHDMRLDAVSDTSLLNTTLIGDGTYKLMDCMYTDTTRIVVQDGALEASDLTSLGNSPWSWTGPLSVGHRGGSYIDKVNVKDIVFYKKAFPQAKAEALTA